MRHLSLRKSEFVIEKSDNNDYTYCLADKAIKNSSGTL